jgi:50S ribosomal protein L16 3-hydroxylase
MHAHDCATRLLGGCPPRRFLREHWQKKPLLVRAALPGFTGLLPPAELAALAYRDDAQSRLVIRHEAREGTQGPFERSFCADFPRAGGRCWSRCQSLPPEARRCSTAFLIPYARLDDRSAMRRLGRGRSALRFLRRVSTQGSGRALADKPSSAT